MCCVSPPSPPMDERHPTSPFPRRLEAEWTLLQELAVRNPGRFANLRREDTVFSLLLLGTTARAVRPPGAQLSQALLHKHAIRIDFPPFFPAVPMELYLGTPVFHPNVHPETGFVCLWDRHRVSNTVALALHKTVAILSWQLYNPDPAHVMQPEALASLLSAGDAIPGRPAQAPLAGTETFVWASATGRTSMRQRLS